MPGLFNPITIGDSLELRNRINMGALTRNRCINHNKPTEAVVAHYAMRARNGPGLIVGEGTFICPQGSEYPYAPVMYKEEHARAWEKVTDAVHREGGTMFFQAWHAGRLQHEDMPMLKESGFPVQVPSNVPAPGGKFRLLEGVPGYSHNLTEIKDPNEVVEQYKSSARLAKLAGFDGIELVSQGGYLLHSFMMTHTNKRKDSYGGSVKNRCRIVLEIVDALCDIWGPRRIGIKICPTDDVNDSIVSYKELSETYTYLIKEIVARELAYVNLTRRGCVKSRADGLDEMKLHLRPAGKELPPGYDPLKQFGPMIKFPGSKTKLMVNWNFSIEAADKLVKESKIDMVEIGLPFVTNPDLVSRAKNGIPLAENDRGGKVYYGPYSDVNENYNDWPTAAEAVPVKP